MSYSLKVISGKVYLVDHPLLAERTIEKIMSENFRPSNSAEILCSLRPDMDGGYGTRVCVVGAGPSGLAVLRAFEVARQEGTAIPELVCFEKSATWGGLWNYTWRTGVDEYGEPVHGSMYRYLWSNGPKECLEFADYTFDDHFKRPVPSFPPRAVLHDYVTSRAQRNNVKQHIQFSTVVRWIEYLEDIQKFVVTVENLPTKELYPEMFDFVMVANGHYSVPNAPYFEGMEQFPGRILHSHDFRSADEFVGQDVLIIGSSYSAEDIALQCFKYGAKSVVISYRNRPLLFKWPDEITVRPLLQKLQGKAALFRDGSSAEVDSVILCTGYQHSNPFLADNLRLRTPNTLYPAGLYKGVFWLDNPKLMYIGKQDQYFTFTMFDAQAAYARDFVLEKLRLPPTEDRIADTEKWLKDYAALTNEREAIDFQAEYIQDLVQVTGYPASDAHKAAAIFKQWEEDRAEDIFAYRDKVYASTITGTMASPHHTVWIKAMDDSLDTFLALNRDQN